jgi:hypothetical protein
MVEVKGVWTHTNTRKDKTDMFPQQELIGYVSKLIKNNRI